MDNDSRYRITETVRWAVSRRGIQLLDTRSRKGAHLAYPEAAIWDLMSRGQGEEEVARRVALIAGTSQTRARELISATLKDWTESGFLTYAASQEKV
jgi:hypothetical protein